MPTTPKYWNRRDGWAALLLPLAKLFETVVTLRQKMYRSGWLASAQVGVKVVVVGNITAGGTGKTPLVLWLAHFLRERGMHPGIVTRGYGGTRQGESEVQIDDPAAEVGDEAALLARESGVPVWRGIDRLVTAQRLIAAHPECDVILSDDGLQHYRLARDIEIAVIDGTRGFYNGWPLPAGPLREPISRLGTVDFIIVKEPVTQLIPEVEYFGMQLKPQRFVNIIDTQQTADPSHFGNQRVHAVAGIGNPEQFFELLRNMGLNITAHAFDDHHQFKASDLAFGTTDNLVVMTQKDAVKCRTFAHSNCWALPVIAEIDSGFAEQFYARLHHGSRPKTA